jgi:hypothetical protein
MLAPLISGFYQLFRDQLIIGETYRKSRLKVHFIVCFVFNRGI